MPQKSARLLASKRRLQTLARNIGVLNEKSGRLSTLRAALFTAALAVSGIFHFWIDETLSWVFLIAGLLAFIIAAIYHRRINRSLKNHELWLEMKTRQVARMELDWEKIPEHPPTELSTEHPFAVDLGIAGRRSLFQLCNSAVSLEGGQKLLHWLTDTTLDESAIQKRQKIVRELVPQTHFRNRLYLDFANVSQKHLNGGSLIRWLGRHETPKALRWLIPLLTTLGLINIALFLLAIYKGFPAYWQLSLFVYIALLLWNWKPAANILSDSVFMDDELNKARAILDFLEKYNYQSGSALATLCEPFLNPATRPSKFLRRIKWAAFLTGLRGNPAIAIVLNIGFPYDLYCARFVNKCKLDLAKQMPVWLDAFFELEAYLSLANFAWLNPHYCFPTISQNGEDGALFSGEDLGHPLIPDPQKVINPVRFHKVGEIMLITGSNMSGKSTYLKTLGVNLGLAYAGGAVDASRFSCGMMRIYTCLNISDSVTEGYSFFYAEVRRLKKLLNLLEEEHETPVFFLVDEIFKGTNNRERLIGSRSFIRAIVNKNGLGAISTHDLELVSLGEAFESIENYHFREEVIDSKMAFDYKIRTGPCPTTNALRIMEIEGLPVDESQG